jgi:hypothetical protein
MPRARPARGFHHRRTTSLLVCSHRPSFSRAHRQSARTAGGGESASLALRAALGGDAPASARPPLSMQLDTIRALAYATHLMNVAEDAEVRVLRGGRFHA